MKIKIILQSAILLLVSSCSNWLDVKPTDKITEELVYNTVSGFKNALNGIYIEMNDKSVYGENLTYGFVDILAYPYNINSENSDIYTFLDDNYDYDQSYAKGKAVAIWNKMFSLIANTNVLLENCENQRSVLSDDYYAIIKGEALALRAMFHLDILRMFGPIPTESWLQTPILPYNKEFQFAYSGSVSLQEYLANIVADLESAAELIKEHDPVVEVGMEEIGDDAFKHFRMLRLNYYAIKTLLARTYLYGAAVEGYKDLALAAAEEVIEAQTRLFPFTKGTDMATSNSNPDKLCFSEVLFSLQNKYASSIFYTYDIRSNTNTTLYCKSFVVRNMFVNNDYNYDYRYLSWLTETFDVSGTQHQLFAKFELGDDTSLLMNNVIPLIRVTEAYYIAAECLGFTDEGKEYLEGVRSARGNPFKSYNSYMYDRNLTSEYQREFWGEGQLFFYYKRRGLSTITEKNGGTRAMGASQYVVPAPDDELPD